MDWIINHAYWIAGAAVLFALLTLFLHQTLRAIRLRASVLGLLLIAASVILWPARHWVAQYRGGLGPGDPLSPSFVTVALWLAIVAIPIALVGRPRLIPVIVLGSLGSIVFWFTTTLPHDSSALSALRIPKSVLTGSPAAPSPRPSPGTPGR